jgi:hypothetical protein
MEDALRGEVPGPDVQRIAVGHGEGQMVERPGPAVGAYRVVTGGGEDHHHAGAAVAESDVADGEVLRIGLEAEGSDVPGGAGRHIGHPELHVREPGEGCGAVGTGAGDHRTNATGAVAFDAFGASDASDASGAASSAPDRAEGAEGSFLQASLVGRKLSPLSATGWSSTGSCGRAPAG